jgi:Holliday junction DNA helicase RuvA
MFYSLSGKLIYTTPSTAVIECGGVGYLCRVTMNTLQKLPDIGENVFLYTHLNISQDSISLFGFASQEELLMFKMLISVSGAGPKAAISLLSDFTPDALALCLATGDHKSLTRSAGIGPKLAQRICLELKDKVSGGKNQSVAFDAPKTVNIGGNCGDAIAALVALGYSQSEAAGAVAKLDQTLSTEDLIKEAMKVLF